MKFYMHMSMGRIIPAKHFHRPNYLHTLGTCGDQNLRLSCMLRSIGFSYNHNYHDFTPHIASARDIEFLPTYDPFITIQNRAGGNISCIRRCHSWFSHREGRAYLTSQKRLQPLLFLLYGAITLKHFHISSIRSTAIHRLRSQTASSHNFCEMSILKVGYTSPPLTFG